MPAKTPLKKNRGEGAEGDEEMRCGSVRSCCVTHAAMQLRSSYHAYRSPTVCGSNGPSRVHLREFVSTAMRESERGDRRRERGRALCPLDTCVCVSGVCVCGKGVIKGERHETMETGQVRRRRRDGVWFRECAPLTGQLTIHATIKIPQRAPGPSQGHVAACACLLRRCPCRYGLRSLFRFYRVCRRRCYSMFVCVWGGGGREGRREARESHLCQSICGCA